MSLSFPIQKQPRTGWTWETEENMLRSNTEAGYVISRPRYTRARDTIEAKWDLIDTEVDTLMDFYKNDTVFGSVEFQLTIVTPNLTITKTVQFAKPPKSTYQGIGVFETDCSFREV